MLYFASEKAMVENIIPKPEVGSGHPLAFGLPSCQHGLKAGVKAEVRSTSPEGLGLDSRFGHATVFKGKRAKIITQKGKNHNILYRPIKKSDEPLYLYFGHLM
jgi:hypothetical protein